MSLRGSDTLKDTLTIFFETVPLLEMLCSFTALDLNISVSSNQHTTLLAA